MQKKYFEYIALHPAKQQRQELIEFPIHFNCENKFQQFLLWPVSISEARIRGDCAR